MNGFRRVKYMLLCVIVGLLLTGCANMMTSTQFSPSKGFIVTTFSAPLQLNYPEKGVKITEASGSASSYYIHDILFSGMTCAWDNCSIDEAARNGNIRNVHYADYSLLTVLGIFGKTTTTVYGEK
ncbi:MAG: TRL domain-containing protein [Lentisphaeria bacterium]